MDTTRRVAWGWKEELWRYATELEDWLDDMALRLGDAIFGEETSEKIFGPHPDRLHAFDAR